MKLLATSDLHIRKKEDTALLQRILALAAERECGAVLIGGDLLDSPFIDPETESVVLALLGGAPCPVFLAAGNHDPLAVTALYQKLPAGVQCFPAAMTCYTLAEGIRLYGCSAEREQEEAPLLRGFAAPEGGCNLFLGHGQPDGGRGAFRPVRAEDLMASNLQLAVIGHIHKGEQRMIGGCRLLVPGIPEGRGWDETGEKFVYIIRVTAGGAPEIEPCPVARRSFWELAADLSGCRDTEEMLERLLAVEIPAGVEARIIMTGAPSASAGAAARAYTEQTGREVVDETDPSMAAELLRGQNTLQGAFVRRAMAEIEAASPGERPQLEAALRLGLRALKEARL